MSGLSERASAPVSDAFAAPQRRAALKKRARAAGKNLSRYLVDRALADAAAHPPEAGSEEERWALPGAFPEAVEALAMLRRELPGCGGLTLFDAIEILARERAQ